MKYNQNYVGDRGIYTLLCDDISVFLLCFTPVFGQDEDLQTLLEQVVAPTDNGIVILVRQGDETLFAYVGMADLEQGIKIQPTDAFRIAIVSKTFVATWA